MGTWRVQVEYADGNDWDTPRHFSEVEVEADSERAARLTAEQMIYTPAQGKPEHIQIVRTEVVGYIE